MNTASDSVVSKNGNNTISFVSNKDPFESDLSSARINQQRLLPQSVQTRGLASIISNNPESSALGSGTVLQAIAPANFSVSFNFTVSDAQGREIVAIPDVAFYIGSHIGGDTQWPGQVYGMGNMPVAIFNDWGLTNNYNVVTRAVIRNNTGVDQNVFCVARHRIIANPGSTSTTSNLPVQADSVPGSGGGGGH